MRELELLEEAQNLRSQRGKRTDESCDAERHKVVSSLPGAHGGRGA